VALKTTTKPSAELLASLKRHKAEIVALLRKEGREPPNLECPAPEGCEPHVTQASVTPPLDAEAAHYAAIRPKGYSDAKRAAAIADARRLGYSGRQP
jgi:hypothetical protein